MAINTVTGWVTAPFATAKDAVTSIDLCPNKIAANAWGKVTGGTAEAVDATATIEPEPVV